MVFKEFWNALARDKREAFAKRCGVSKGHLNNIAGGSRQASPWLAYKIEQESNGMVTKESVRPDAKW